MRNVRVAVVALVVVLLVACASKTRAPVDDRSAMPSTPTKPPVAAAASPPAPAPASDPDRTPTYTVRRGDTLYQIALDHGLDYKDLAAWNGLADPNRIQVGQVLRVAAPGEVATTTTTAGVTTAPLKPQAPVTSGTAVAGAGTTAATVAPSGPRNADNYKSSPKAVKEPYSEQAMRDVARAAQAPPEVVAAAPASTSAPSASSSTASAAKPDAPKAAAPPTTSDVDDEEKLDWAWPAKGKVVVGFSETANLKGIDIAGASGDPVIASAAGKVVYVGNGLRGYGKLVIVKHNKTWLSAYAHNREVLVKEGQQVTKGQKIAEMGNTDADQVKLHFEIRRLGKPVDPARYLPAG